MDYGCFVTDSEHINVLSISHLDVIAMLHS